MRDPRLKVSRFLHQHKPTAFTLEGIPYGPSSGLVSAARSRWSSPLFGLRYVLCGVLMRVTPYGASETICPLTDTVRP